VTLPHPNAEMKFRSTFEECFDAMNRYCLRRLPTDEVNDAVAEVFAVAWRKIEQVPDGDETLPWLYGVARYEVSNRRRTARRSLALKQKLKGLAHHADPGPEPEIIRASELQHLVDALGFLKADDRELLLLRTQEELSYSQMAVAFNCSPEAVRKRLSRALTRLRKAANLPEPYKMAIGTRAIEEGGDQ
jgi:RNA polymerase sigma-70 factor (ECF subfamily)